MTSFKLCKVLGIQRERLKDWQLRGFVSASFPADGQGTKANFSRRDVIKISTFKKMIEMGFSRKVALETINQWPIKTNFDIQIAQHLQSFDD